MGNEATDRRTPTGLDIMQTGEAPQIEEQLLRTSDGLELYACWHFTDQPLGVVILIHGLGEHSSRYGHVIHRLQQAGLMVFRFDLRGHGRSQGRPGHVETYDQLMDDLTLAIREVEGRYPGLPLILFGHSLGGNLVTNWLLRRRSNQDPIAGAVISATWFELVDRPGPIKVALVRWLSRKFPRLVIPASLRPRKLTRNPTAIQQYVHDPMIHKTITARMAVEVHDAAAWALEHADQFPVPVLATHGMADEITAPAGTELFCSLAPDAELMLFPGLIHEPHNEPEWPEVVNKICDWIVQRVQAFAPAA